MKTTRTLTLPLASGLAALAILAALAPLSAKSDDVKPFKASLAEGPQGLLTEADFPAEFDAWAKSENGGSDPYLRPLYAGDGNCNVGGRYTSRSKVMLYTDQFPLLKVYELQTWTMANGDQLISHNIGTIVVHFDGTPSSLSWDIEFVGGTGRFEDATGHADGVGTEDDNGATLTITGVISTVDQDDPDNNENDQD